MEVLLIDFVSLNAFTSSRCCVNIIPRHTTHLASRWLPFAFQQASATFQLSEMAFFDAVSATSYFFPDDILLIPIFCSSWSGTESAASWSQESVEQKRTRLLLFFYLAIRVSDQYQAQNKLRMVSRVSRRSSIHAALCFILYSSSTQDSHVEVLKRSSPSTVSSKACVFQSVHVIDVELFIPEVWSVLTYGSCSCFFSVPD